MIFKYMIKEQFETGSFYSVIPTSEGNYDGNTPYLENVDYNDIGHEKILGDLPNKLKNFDEIFGYKFNNKEESTYIMNFLGKNKDIELENNQFNYYLCNGSFEWMDGRMLYYFMSLLKPNKIVEIGTGNSTLLMYNTKKQLNLNTKIICIDKTPHPVIKKLSLDNEIVLFEDDLVNVDLKIFETLNKNDILFIDSSHTVKMNSDVMYYFGKIFPRLKSGVVVQIHDIFLPYEYPLGWIDNGIFWNEQYLLYIFLQNTQKMRVLFSNNYAKFKFHDKLKLLQENYYENKILSDRQNNPEPFAGGSIWLRVV